MTVIPDSIEPVVGWKGFNKGLSRSISGKGVGLFSPTFKDYWPPSAMKTAHCGGIFRGRNDKVGWIYVTRGTEEIPQYMTRRFRKMGLTEHHPDYPPGVDAFGNPNVWTLECWPHTHSETPFEHCNCGIHMAVEPVGTFNYGHDVIAKMAGWGKVIRGTSGHRCQYAYPLELYVDTPEDQERFSIYGVPVYLKTDHQEIGFYHELEQKLLRTNARHSRRFGMPETIYVLNFFLLLSYLALWIFKGGAVPLICALIIAAGMMLLTPTMAKKTFSSS